jgi:hypothetical protein
MAAHQRPNTISTTFCPSAAASGKEPSSRQSRRGARPNESHGMSDGASMMTPWAPLGRTRSDTARVPNRYTGWRVRRQRFQRILTRIGVGQRYGQIARRSQRIARTDSGGHPHGPLQTRAPAASLRDRGDCRHDLVSRRGFAVRAKHPCTSCSTHDLNELDKKGLPGVSVLTVEFKHAFERQISSIGLDAASVFVPHPMQNRMTAELHGFADQSLDQILSAMCSE